MPLVHVFAALECRNLSDLQRANRLESRLIFLTETFVDVVKYLFQTPVLARCPGILVRVCIADAQWLRQQ